MGASVISVESGEYFYRRHDKENFIPASTLKPVTAAAALNALGEDFSYFTALYLDGEIDEAGEFVGNVIVRGSGDPTLSTEFYEDPVDIIDGWTEILDSLGINSIKGNLIGDDNYFDDERYAPGVFIEDAQYPYAAQVSALSLNDNKIDFRIKPAADVGEPASVSYYPKNSYVRAINNIGTGDTNSFAEIVPVKEIGSNIIELYGKVPRDTVGGKTYETSVAVENPTLLFLSVLKNELAERNIRFRGAMLDADDYAEELTYYDLTPTAVFKSRELKEIILIINKRSLNLAAELVFKTIAKETRGETSFAAAAEEVEKFLAGAGVNVADIHIADGSGLSRLNLISPAAQTTFLSYMWRSPNKEIFVGSLARPGKDGTLKKRMRWTRAQKSVKAKTGTMTGVSAICGYVETRDGETLAFSVMIQGHTAPKTVAQNLEDLILMRLSSFSKD